MGVIHAAYGILFIIDGIYSMPYITERKDIHSKPCDIIPANTSLSCRQYVTSDMTYCKEEKLRSLFPDLYNRSDQEWPNWPAKVENIQEMGSNVSWAVPPDGNIHYLKGFQVIQEGNDPDTFGKMRCSVIDLSEMSKADLKLIMEVKFFIENNDSGSYGVEIKPLPLRPEHIQSGEVTVSMEPNQVFNVYHPRIKVSMDFVQVNESVANISVHVDGEVQELSAFEIMLTSGGRYIENLAKRFTISQGSFLLYGLKEGSYVVKITPLESDETPEGRCLCYFGTNESRACALCTGYTKTIQMQHLKEIIKEDVSMVTVILAPVVVLLLLGIIALSVWYVWYRDKLPAFIDIPASWRRNRPSDNFDCIEDYLTKSPTIRIIYTYDHLPHKAAVKALATLIQNSTKLQVITNDNDESVESGGSLSSSENSVDSIDGSQFEDAGVICVVHSEWAHKLVSVIGSGEISTTDLINKDHKTFLSCINEICKNPALASKVVSVRFEYTPECVIIKEPFLGPRFHLPAHIDAFIKHLNVKTKHESVAATVTDKMALFSSINTSFAYQNKHKSWLYSKLFYLRNSPISDDSGIVIPRSRNLRSRSIRSRSADTISNRSSACTCDVSSRRTNCESCNQKQLSRLRTYSCDLSFYPPESILDGTSERMSLLESKFIDINGRYQKALGGKSSAEDCYTLDGQSV